MLFHVFDMSTLIVCKPNVCNGDVVELDAAQSLKLDDDVAVIVNAHQHTLGALKLSAHNHDVAAPLPFKRLRSDVGQRIFMVVDYIHKAPHLTLRHCDGSTPRAIMQSVASVLHITQFVGILFLQL